MPLIIPTQKPYLDQVALLAVGWPAFREAVIDYIVGFDAERVLDEFGGTIGVVTGTGVRGL